MLKHQSFTSMAYSVHDIQHYNSGQFVVSPDLFNSKYFMSIFSNYLTHMHLK